MYINSNEENKNRNNNTKNKSRKAVSRAMKEKSEEPLTGLIKCSNGMFGLVRGLEINSKEVVMWVDV